MSAEDDLKRLVQDAKGSLKASKDATKADVAQAYAARSMASSFLAIATVVVAMATGEKK